MGTKTCKCGLSKVPEQSSMALKQSTRSKLWVHRVRPNQDTGDNLAAKRTLFIHKTKKAPVNSLGTSVWAQTANTHTRSCKKQSVSNWLHTIKWYIKQEGKIAPWKERITVRSGEESYSLKILAEHVNDKSMLKNYENSFKGLVHLPLI